MPVRFLKMLQAHPYALLYLLALLVRLGIALVVRQPGFVDAYYYYQIAQNWQAGRGLTESTVWNFQAGGLFDPAQPGALDHPAFAYWMPLASFLVIASFAVFGVSFWAASLPFILGAAFLPPLAYWLGQLFFGKKQRRYSWLMAIVMLFGGRYFLYWNTPDNFTPFALILMLGLAAIWGGLRYDQRWLLAAGGLAGLAYLSRSDGLLLPLTLLVCVLWQYRPRNRSVPQFNRLELIRPRPFIVIGSLGLSFLVVLPWLVRNLLEFGSLLPANSAKVLFLHSYADFFSYDLRLDSSYYFALGLNNILGSKLEALLGNAMLLVFQGPFLLGPLFLVGLWVVRKEAAFRPFVVYSLLLYGVMSLAFTQIGSRGTLFHSAGGLLPLQAGIALAGLEKLLRGRARPRAALTLALVAVATTLYFAAVVSGPQWDGDYQSANRLEGWFASNAGPKDVIMIGEPLSFHYATGRPAITQASDGLAANLATAERYGVRWFVLGPERYGGLDDLYQNKKVVGTALDLRLVAELSDGIQIYEVKRRNPSVQVRKHSANSTFSTRN